MCSKIKYFVKHYARNRCFANLPNEYVVQILEKIPANKYMYVFLQ